MVVVGVVAPEAVDVVEAATAAGDAVAATRIRYGH